MEAIAIGRLRIDPLTIDGARAHAERMPAEERAASERRLVERAQRGDHAAFGALYQRYVDDVYAYVHMRVRDTAVAEDLTQDIFANAYRGLKGFRWTSGFGPWLMRSAHNRVANHWRSRGRAPQMVSLPDPDDPGDPRPELVGDDGVSTDLDLHVHGEAVAAAMHRLTDLQQQVLALRFGAGMTIAETSDIMGRSANAVKNLQHNALASLRRILDRGGDLS